MAGNGFFDEYAFKNCRERVRLEYLREDQGRLNPWEITNFVNRITTCMYKIEVINTVALALNQGVEKKNLFVMDKSYRLNGAYRELSGIRLETMALNRVYAMGKPQSMEPNRDLQELNFLFEGMYRINQLLYQTNSGRLAGYERLEAYSMMKREGFSAALRYLLERAWDCLAYTEREKAGKKFDDLYEEADKRHQQYLTDQRQFAELGEKLELGDTKELTKGEREFEKRYYQQFYDSLFYQPRPIVGIYDKAQGSLSILCADHFNDRREGSAGIDLKSVTQNSPVKTIIEAGCEILALKKDEERKREIHELQKEKLRLEIENEKKAGRILEQKTQLLIRENRRMEQESRKNELDIINKKLENAIKMNALAKQEEQRGIEGMEPSYAARQLGVIYGKLQNAYAGALSANRFIEQSVGVLDTTLDIKV